ncbi:MAG: lactate racemase domain-containing protein [Verrucomicrobiota bacterium]
MRIPLAYGRGRLDVDFPDDLTTVIEPTFRPGLRNEQEAFIAALDHPIGTPTLRSWVRSNSRICILFTDITRATPNERIIPWLLAYLERNGIRREQITLLNQLGTHRPNTREELERMLTPEVVAHYRVLNHEPESREACVQLGTTRTGAPVLINRHAVEADVRILTGFIEPHFFAGFSGGPKALMPGVAHLETVMSNHQDLHPRRLHPGPRPRLPCSPRRPSYSSRRSPRGSCCRRRPGMGPTLQRHPFSGLVDSAGELLHTP